MLTFPCASTSLSSYHIKCWHILQTSLFTSPNLHQNYFVTMSVKLACTPTTLLFFLTPVWLVQYQDKMYRMRGNADSASLFLDSVSRWCSLLARKQWVMLKPMDVNCQATGAWQYILFGSIKTALYPTRYNMSFWSVNIQLADPLPVFCRGVTLVGFVWLSASQISWSRMFAKHFIHPLSHQSSTFLFLTVKHIFCLPTRSLETCMYCWCIWTLKMQILVNLCFELLLSSDFIGSFLGFFFFTGAGRVHVSAQGCWSHEEQRCAIYRKCWLVNTMCSLLYIFFDLWVAYLLSLVLSIVNLK